MSGTITYAKDEVGKKADTYPIKYFLSYNSSPKKTASNGGTDAPSEKSKMDEYNDNLRDLGTIWIPKLDKEGGEKLYDELTKTYPNHLPIHSSYLQLIDLLDKRVLPTFKKKSSGTLDELNKVIATCEKVLGSVNEETILAYMATKTDLRSDAAKHKV